MKGGEAVETWKPCPLSPFGEYWISDAGRVRNRLGKVLSPAINRYGYRFVILHHAPHKKMCLVHRLVAAAFIGSVEGQDVHHKDGNRENNLPENLEILPHDAHMEKQIFRKPTGRKRGRKKKVPLLVQYRERFRAGLEKRLRILEHARAFNKGGGQGKL